MVSMSDRSPRGRRRSIPAAIGGVLLAVVAAYLGIDVSHHGDQAGPKPDDAASSSKAPSGKAPSSKAPAGTAGLATCGIDSLPKQAEQTASDILAGGPFEHPGEDNKHFGNYEGKLPRNRSDYYREFTVDTPGLGHRGERRIITGGGTDKDPDVWYYTDDHYESFCQIPDAEEKPLSTKR